MSGRGWERRGSEGRKNMELGTGMSKEGTGSVEPYLSCEKTRQEGGRGGMLSKITKGLLASKWRWKREATSFETQRVELKVGRVEMGVESGGRGRDTGTGTGAGTAMEIVCCPSGGVPGQPERVCVLCGDSCPWGLLWCWVPAPVVVVDTSNNILEVEGFCWGDSPS